MTEIAFFRHERVDRAIRMGLEIDNHTVLHDFQSGDDDDDPSLLWYVDVIIQGDGLPRDPDGARDWLRDHGGKIQDHLRAMANEMSTGIEWDVNPFRRQGELEPGCSFLINVSALRRVAAREFSKKLLELADQWDDHLEKLSAFSEV